MKPNSPMERLTSVLEDLRGQIAAAQESADPADRAALMRQLSDMAREAKAKIDDVQKDAEALEAEVGKRRAAARARVELMRQSRRNVVPPHECKGVETMRLIDGQRPPHLPPFDIRSSPATVRRMLELAAVGPSDLVCDLGCGDGRVLLAAARDFGARGLGFELRPELVELARKNIRDAGLEHRVDIHAGDLFDADFHRATVVILFLGNRTNLLLRSTLQRQLRPGARIVSHCFDLGDIKPAQKLTHTDPDGSEHLLFLWRVTEQPATPRQATSVDWVDLDDWARLSG
jgi:protein-L-isoaspartate O-methyltransferase